MEEVPVETHRLRALLLTVIAAGSLCAPLAARAAKDPCQFSNVLTIKTAAATFYVDDRADAPPQLGLTSGNGTWMYMESNGIEGLQRGGQSVVLGDQDLETCIDASVKAGGAADALIE